jgi:hypothetical protein
MHGCKKKLHGRYSIVTLRKWWSRPRSLMMNSSWRAETVFWRRAPLEVARTMSSTYKSRYTISEPHQNMKREVSDFALVNPSVYRQVGKRLYQACGACLSPDEPDRQIQSVDGSRWPPRVCHEERHSWCWVDESTSPVRHPVREQCSRFLA